MAPIQRIAVVSDKFPPSWGGGIASAHYQIARVLAKRGFHVDVFTYLDDAAGERDAAIVRRNTPHSIIRIVRRANNLVFRIIDRGKAAYQVADIVARAWGAWRLNRALANFDPHVVIFPDHGSPAFFIRKLRSCRRVLIAHHNPTRFIDLPFIEPHSRRDIRFANAVENRVLRTIDKVICPSTHMKSVFIGTHPFKGPIDVVPNVIDHDFLRGIEAHDPRPSMGLPSDALLVYFPGGGNKFKGAGFVPEIVSGLADVAVGPLGVFISGAVGPDLAARLSRLSKNVVIHCPGPLSGTENLALVKACSFVVYPTLVENYSMALLEAAMCGLPMVTFDVGGNAEIVTDGINGFLIDAYEVDALIAAGRRLLEQKTLAGMRASTLADAERRLSATALADRVVDSLTSFAGN